MKITVLGAGSWGATLAALLLENGHDVTLWEFDKQRADDLQARKIKPFFAGIDCLKVYLLPTALIALKTAKGFYLSFRRNLCVLRVNF